MNSLTACVPAWKNRENDIHEDNFYIEIADFGKHIVDFVNNGDGEKFHSVFEIIESALTLGDEETKNLIGAGLLEAMQNHELDPPDLLDKFFGVETLKVWQDIIEGWIGDGIRSIEKWKRVIRNGKFKKIIISVGIRRIEIENNSSNEYKGSKISKEHESIEITSDVVKVISGFFRPLVSEELIGSLNEVDTSSMGFDKPYALIMVIQPSTRGTTVMEKRIEIKIGVVAGNNHIRFATDGERIYLLSIEHLVDKF